MYQTKNKFKKGYKHTFNMIKKINGELAMNIKETAETLKEYFDKLLNSDEPKQLLKIENRHNNEIKVEELTIEKIKSQWEI